MGRQLGVPAIFFERVEGKLVLRRGFNIAKGARVLMVEDIVTTGLSSRECIAGIAEEGGVTLAAACLIDRSGGKADLGVPLFALTSLEIPAYPADNSCLSGGRPAAGAGGPSGDQAGQPGPQ
ncbi:unnamed protein product [Phaeothamnion confervicola]